MPADRRRLSRLRRPPPRIEHYHIGSPGDCRELKEARGEKAQAVLVEDDLAPVALDIERTGFSGEPRQVIDPDAAHDRPRKIDTATANPSANPSTKPATWATPRLTTTPRRSPSQAAG